MNTEYVAVNEHASVADAIEALRENEELLETLHTLFLIDSEDRLRGTVPLARLLLQEGATSLASLVVENPMEVLVDEHRDRVTEMFDKYTLLALPVVNHQRKLAGVITADDIISVLREKR